MLTLHVKQEISSHSIETTTVINFWPQVRRPWESVAFPAQSHQDGLSTCLKENGKTENYDFNVFFPSHGCPGIYPRHSPVVFIMMYVTA